MHVDSQGHGLSRLNAVEKWRMGFCEMEMARPTGDLLDCIIGEESVAQLWEGGDLLPLYIFRLW